MSIDPRNGSAEVNRLRASIDAGKTGDKVRVEDPAAAPMGTDDEAAGTRVPLRAARMAHAQEVAAAGAAGERQGATNPARTRPRRSGVVIVAIIAVVVIVVLAAVFMMGRTPT